MNTIERRKHRRVEVEFWASLNHPLLGTITADVQDMSVGGLSLTLDEEVDFFVMMELDIRIHGEGWDDSMPALPVQVVRVNKRNIGLRFFEYCDDLWSPPPETEFEFSPDEAELCADP